MLYKKSGNIISLFTAEKRKEGAKLRRDILLYFNTLRSSVVFLRGSLRLNFLLLIQPLHFIAPGIIELITIH